MKHQKGSSLIFSLIILTIITLVAVYSIEGTVLQSKMVANSLFSSLTYQECRNEQEASVRYFNDNGGEKRTELLDLEALNISLSLDSSNSDTPTSKYTENTPKSHIQSTWGYIRKAPNARSGYEVEVGSPSVALLFQNDCIADFRFATNNQSLGAVVDKLSAGNSIN
jgi:hypothetical protein